MSTVVHRDTDKTIFRDPDGKFRQVWSTLAADTGLVRPQRAGAAGDGVRDDRAELQAAIDAGGIVDGGGATFRCTSFISLRNRSQLRNLKILADHDGIALSTPGPRLYDIQLRNVQVEQAAGRQATVGIDLPAVSTARFDSVTVRGFAAGTGIRLRGATAGWCVYNEFYGVTVFGCDVGVDIQGLQSNQQRWFGGRINGKSFGLKVSGANCCQFYGVSLEGDGSGTAVWLGTNATAVVVDAPRFEGWARGVHFLTATNSRVRDAYVSAVTTFVTDEGTGNTATALN